MKTSNTDVDMLNTLKNEVEPDRMVEVSMDRLKRIFGYNRLGSEVIKNIDQFLTKNGLKHLERELPKSQDKHITLYQSGGLVDRKINGN